MADKSGAVRQGRAYVELFTDKSPAIRGLNQFANEFKSWGKRLSTAGSFTLGGATAIAAPLALAVKSFADVGSALNDMSARTGASVGSLSLLKFSADQNGTSLEALEESVKKYHKTTADALQGNVEAAQGFSDLGLSARSLNKLPLEEQLAQIGERLALVPAGALRTAAAMKLFGKSGADLLPMLSQLRQDVDRANQLGLKWADDEGPKADALGDRWDELKAVALRTAQVVGGALQPALMELSEPLLAAAVATREFIAENPGVVETTAMVAAGAGAAGAALITLGVSSQLAGMGLATVATGLKTVAGLAGALASPFVLTTAAVVGAGVAIANQTEVGRSNLNSLADAARTSGGAVVTAWQGITDAIAGQDLGLAGAIAMAGLDVVMTAGLREITDRWYVTVAALEGVWSSVWTSIMGVVDGAYGFIQQKMHRLAESLVSVEMSVRVSLGDITQEQADREMIRIAGKHRESERIQQNQANARQEQGADDVAAIEEARNQKLIESERALIDSQKKLDDLRTEAAEKREKGKTAGSKKRKLGAGEGVDGVAGKGGTKSAQGTFSGLVANLNRGFAIPTGPDAEMNRLGGAIDETTGKLGQQADAFTGWRDKAVGAIGDVKDAAAKPVAPAVPPEPPKRQQQNEAKVQDAADREQKKNNEQTARADARWKKRFKESGAAEQGWDQEDWIQSQIAQEKGQFAKSRPEVFSEPGDRHGFGEGQYVPFGEGMALPEKGETQKRGQYLKNANAALTDQTGGFGAGEKLAAARNVRTQKGFPANTPLSTIKQRFPEEVQKELQANRDKNLLAGTMPELELRNQVGKETHSRGDTTEFKTGKIVSTNKGPADAKMAALDAKIADADANAKAFAGMAKDSATQSKPVLIASPQQALPVSPEGRAAMAEVRGEQPPVVSPPATAPVSVGAAAEPSPLVPPPTVSSTPQPESVVDTLRRLSEQQIEDQRRALGSEGGPIQLPSRPESPTATTPTLPTEVSATEQALRSFGERLALVSTNLPDFSKLRIPSVEDFQPRQTPDAEATFASNQNDELLTDIRDTLKRLDQRVASGSNLKA